MEAKDSKKITEVAEDTLEFPGVAINVGDDEKEDKDLVKERTSTLNNNPRNTDGPKD